METPVMMMEVFSMPYALSQQKCQDSQLQSWGNTEVFPAFPCPPMMTPTPAWQSWPVPMPAVWPQAWPQACFVPGCGPAMIVPINACAPVEVPPQILIEEVPVQGTSSSEGEEAMPAMTSSSGEESSSPRTEEAPADPLRDLLGRLKDKLVDSDEPEICETPRDEGAEDSEELDSVSPISELASPLLGEDGRKMGQEILKLLQTPSGRVTIEEASSEAPSLSSTKRARKHRRGREASSRGQRLCCNFVLGMGSDYVPAIIGRRGINTKSIYEETGCKVRVRGRGSGHQEQGSNKEAPTNLMLAVTAEADNSDGFCKAVAMSLTLLEEVEQRYYFDHWWHPESFLFSIHMEHEDLKEELAVELGENFLARVS
ncbi:unnamed protein product [Symbiodinium sp. CCMP2592]|nr:unnamed protein product [Symbiodinium sp. CCMP2592]